MIQKNKKTKTLLICLVVLTFAISTLFSFNILVSADPEGPTSIVSISNETKGTNAAAMFNISGGYIAALNLTASVQNTHWKAFVGWVNGAFTLDDSSGSTIYDWKLSITTGRVYATRDSSTIEWNLIRCASSANLTNEDIALFHNRASDNITATFRTSPQTHDAFWVAGRSISQDSCPTLNTYVNDTSQDDDFEEIALHDTTSMIYATILENRLTGYDGNRYDFQMLAPENGSIGFTGATPYYLYVELD